MIEHWKILDQYLELRRALGFGLIDTERQLRKFIGFLEVEGADYITTDLARCWATSNTNAQPAQWASRLRAVRQLARYWSGIDSRTEVPPQKLLPHHHKRAHPYIYSPDEISAVIKGSGRLRPLSGLRSVTMSTLFGMLAATGLRVGEAVALDNLDVELEDAVLHIRRAKFGKSRLVPIHCSVISALREYIHRRNRFHRSLCTPAFFVNDQGNRVSSQSARLAFRQVSCRVGLRDPQDRRGPRIHDFRHTFAVTTLLNWYRQGLDVERELPKLATYLGHTHWSETYWYLTSVPELMSLACDRLEQAFGGQR